MSECCGTGPGPRDRPLAAPGGVVSLGLQGRVESGRANTVRLAAQARRQRLQYRMRHLGHLDYRHTHSTMKAKRGISRCTVLYFKFAAPSLQHLHHFAADRSVIGSSPMCMPPQRSSPPDNAATWAAAEAPHWKPAICNFLNANLIVEFKHPRRVMKLSSVGPAGACRLEQAGGEAQSHTLPNGGRGRALEEKGLRNGIMEEKGESECSSVQ